MKKIYVVVMAFGISLSLNAQMKQKPALPSNAVLSKESVKPNIPDLTNDSVNKSGKTSKPLSGPQGRLKSMTYWEQVIGYTTYDNQTNNSVQDRVILDDEGGVHSTWTMSFSSANTFEDRGTGYNSGEGFIWGEEPYERIEDVRTGWPGLIKTGDNKEMIICHTSEGPLVQLKRNTIGSGTWEQSTIPTALGRDMLWPRACVDGNTIHLIALTAGSALDGSPLNGVDGNLIYFRSLDNGETWDIQDHVFDAIDSLEFSRIDGDGYAIHARDGRVSIGVFSEFHDTFLLTSSDSGTSWDYTLVSDFEIPGYQIDSLSDADGDGAADTLFTTDGNGAVHIDANGTTHMVFGSNFILDNDPGDEMYNYFNMLDLLYWNTTFETDSIYVIATAEENPDDNDDIFTITLAEIPNYGCSMASMASMGEDEDGNIYVLYSAADEQFIDQQVFRHLYVIKSEDLGENWQTPVELTPDLDFNGYEYTYPSLNRDITDQLHITVQRDYEPGLSVRGDLDDIDENEIVYLSVTTDFDLVLNTNEGPETVDNVVLYPNPSSGIINLQGENLQRQNLSVFDASGKQVLQMTPSADALNAGRIELNFGFLAAGSYTLVMGSGDNKVVKDFIIRK